jgi:hypothetical protein
METARGRAQRRHVREKATIDHLVRDVYEPKTPDEKQTERRPTMLTGLPVEDQVRKEWEAALARIPRFFGDKRQITSVTELPMPAMPSPPRLRKRSFEATAATSAADEIDIAGCAAIAYTSEDPAHPVEHMLDGCCGPGAPRWSSARPDTTEHIVIEFDRAADDLGPRLRGRGDDARAYPGSTRGSLGKRRPIVPPNSGSGIQLQPRGSHLSARRTALQSPPSHPSPSHDCSKQERLRHGDADGAPPLRLEVGASSLWPARSLPVD